MRPNALALSCAAILDRECSRTVSTLQNGPDLEAAKRRQLERHVGRLPDFIVQERLSPNHTSTGSLFAASECHRGLSNSRQHRNAFCWTSGARRNASLQTTPAQDHLLLPRACTSVHLNHTCTSRHSAGFMKHSLLAQVRAGEAPCTSPSHKRGRPTPCR
jgi:hypothetical protein